jgi:hypothetical protein
VPSRPIRAASSSSTPLEATPGVGADNAVACRNDDWNWAGGYWIDRPWDEAYWVPGHWAERWWGWTWVGGHWF